MKKIMMLCGLSLLTVFAQANSSAALNNYKKAALKPETSYFYKLSEGEAKRMANVLIGNAVTRYYNLDYQNINADKRHLESLKNPVDARAYSAALEKNYNSAYSTFLTKNSNFTAKSAEAILTDIINASQEIGHIKAETDILKRFSSARASVNTLPYEALLKNSANSFLNSFDSKYNSAVVKRNQVLVLEGLNYYNEKLKETHYVNMHSAVSQAYQNLGLSSSSVWSGDAAGNIIKSASDAFMQGLTGSSEGGASSGLPSGGNWSNSKGSGGSSEAAGRAPVVPSGIDNW